MSGREAICCGNWKANGTRADLESWAASFDSNGVQAVLSVPHPLLASARRLLEGKATVAAQDVADHGPGARTGGTTAAMVADAGAIWTLVGHSERRQHGETDQQIAAKLEQAAANGLRPILCIGENLDEREAGRLEEVLQRQLEAVSEAAVEKLPETLVVAYEPVWAIGTGQASSSADAQQACAWIRNRLSETLGSDKIPLLYGGSVSVGNAGDYLGEADIDGLLVGGASLDAASFSGICAVANDLKP